MEFELRYCIDHHDGKLLGSRLDRFSYPCESILSHESPFHFEASCILGILVASVVLLLYQECRSIVPFRQASNPHQNIVWIISGLPTIVQILARILAPNFTVAVHWSEFHQQKGEWEISVVSNWSSAAGFTGALRSLDNSLHKSAVAP